MKRCLWSNKNKNKKKSEILSIGFWFLQKKRIELAHMRHYMRVACWTCESQVVSHLMTESWDFGGSICDSHIPSHVEHASRISCRILWQRVDPLAASSAKRILPSHVEHASRMWCTGVACCAFQVFPTLILFDSISQNKNFLILSWWSCVPNPLVGNKKKSNFLVDFVESSVRLEFLSVSRV